MVWNVCFSPLARSNGTGGKCVCVCVCVFKGSCLCRGLIIASVYAIVTDYRPALSYYLLPFPIRIKLGEIYLQIYHR